LSQPFRGSLEAADRAMQVHGGMGYSRNKPFEHIYRHHRRHRITEGSEEIQKRKVAGFLFGYCEGNGKNCTVVGTDNDVTEYLDIPPGQARALTLSLL
jgi:hypothetical protein